MWLHPSGFGASPIAFASPAPNAPATSNSVTVPTAELVGVALVVVLLLLLLLILLRRSAKSARSSSKARSSVARLHFVPDDIALIVQHAPGLASDQLLRSVAQDPAIASSAELGRALVRSGRATTLSRGGGVAVSLVAATLQGVKQADMLKLINRLSRQVGAGQRRPAATPNPGTTGIRIVAASPNWLLSGCPAQGGGVGGPGGTPVAPATPPGENAWRLNLPASLAASGEGEGVHVAILDTAPCQADLTRAYARWGTASLGHATASNPLIASLLRPQGPLSVYHAGGAHLLQSVDAHLEDHHYPMPDHGLFVAGIVHSLAPRARIHLIEALNTYGVGSLESFAQAFRVVQLLAEGRDPGRIGDDSGGDVDALAASAVGTVPVVLNCSFMFNVSANPAEDPTLRHDAELTTAMGQFPNVWEALIGNEHVPIVAAAGNDRTVVQYSHGTYPSERYPAAFDDVIGVGALDSSGNPTMYTDLAHTAKTRGIAVFGGDVTPTSGPDALSPYTADASKGLLGLFVGTRFPDGTPNRGGWARWAGTSFSAPIISGCIARSLGATTAGADARSVRDNVLAPLVAASTGETPVGKSLAVTQG